MPPRILLLDIETAPNLAYTWGLWKQDVSLNMLVEPGYVLCYAAKWYGERGMLFDTRMSADWPTSAHSLLDEADIVIHYNGTQFDIPWLNTEFWLTGRSPPSPYRQIDLLQTIRKQFQFPSNKLAHVTERIGLEGKVKHSGFGLWKRCMADDPAAWREMEKYNRRDVVLLEELYDMLQAWIVHHPNVSLFDSGNGCPACGGMSLVKRGFAYTQTGKFQQYRCEDCGKYSRGNKREAGADKIGVTL
jgi:hypothetical protein